LTELADLDPLAGSTLDLTQLWEPTEKNKIIRASHATNRLRVGGTGSSKSSDALMEAFEYMVRYDGIAVLFIRRQLKDLKKSSILDWKAFIPAELYHWDDQNAVATLYNGSKLFFGHLPNNSEKDLEQYLSAAFPVIVMDECGQFSDYAWQFMSSRNRVNRECQRDDQGNFPVPVMLGCTNPIGPHWGFYKAQFVDHKPFDPPEGARKDKNGCWWTPTLADGVEGWQLEYDPAEWDYIHSTLFDNPTLMARDPDLLRKLEALPKALRDKLLSGHLDSTVGQYFDCWSDRNVVDLGEDPDAVIWQPWQPRWMSWDWGRAHWNAVYWFTIAMVKTSSGYEQKTVCYREYVDRGKNYADLAHNVSVMTNVGLPGYPDATSIRIIYFSHEKFSISKEKKETQSPAAILSGHLMKAGLPSLTRNDASPGSRIGKATGLYDKLESTALVVLSVCRHIIESIPQLVRDNDSREDVLKVDGKADDCYDGFSMGIFNWYGSPKPTPLNVRRAEALSRVDTPEEKHKADLAFTKQTHAERRKPRWKRS
jgi:hypothetical protein